MSAHLKNVFGNSLSEPVDKLVLWLQPLVDAVLELVRKLYISFDIECSFDIKC